MKILVLNSGSSSLKYKLFDMKKEEPLIAGHVDGIGLERCELKTNIHGKHEKKHMLVKDHVDAVMIALKSLTEKKIIKKHSNGFEKQQIKMIMEAKIILG